MGPFAPFPHTFSLVPRCSRPRCSRSCGRRNPSRRRALPRWRSASRRAALRPAPRQLAQLLPRQLPRQRSRQRPRLLLRSRATQRAIAARAVTRTVTRISMPRGHWLRSLPSAACMPDPAGRQLRCAGALRPNRRTQPKNPTQPRPVKHFLRRLFSRIPPHFPSFPPNFPAFPPHLPGAQQHLAFLSSSCSPSCSALRCAALRCAALRCAGRDARCAALGGTRAALRLAGRRRSPRRAASAW